MSRRYGQERAPGARPPMVRSMVPPAAPPVSSGAGIAFTEVDITDAWAPALRALIDLRTEIEGTEYVHSEMKRAVLSGVKLCIQRLASEATKR